MAKITETDTPFMTKKFTVIKCEEEEGEGRGAKEGGRRKGTEGEREENWERRELTLFKRQGTMSLHHLVNINSYHLAVTLELRF